MVDICCVGHITLDTVVTTRAVVHMPGGTSFYFSHAMRNMDVSYSLITALAQKEMSIVSALAAKGVAVQALPSRHTVYFENIYPENMDHRIQRVTQKADAFSVSQLQHTQAKIFHLGPLLADDMPVELIRHLAGIGKVSLDVQGYLRKVENQDVVAIDWPAKKEALQYVDVLKANEYEMEVLTGYSSVRQAAMELFSWGVKEVVITLGSKGSVIYNGDDFFHIPAYIPSSVVDATGCGDTYMAGYLYRRIKGDSLQQAGEFAAAMATLKIESSGPFTKTAGDVRHLLAANRHQVKPVLN
ncbi:PfkB family carbohydrate kinase [Foetidibacter luteolus]|uniref:PfkB family carbohydrate kinase n=1 Tax=Foetidibacter luteolus TaxID=2608880 RepID=UPI00129AD32C|nr:PfkB family carbohydrate kinase [Foetidibacter luteolus]